ncbi:MAG TPA: hypothetical protein VNB49_10535 [Candidatus Dormibacteraeota bacterium]|nr:hypothetical protein [Candidatus Dormibacteraeota bacterium]
MGAKQTANNGHALIGGSDTGQYVFPTATKHYPMTTYNGKVVAKADRQAPTCDYDLTPRQLRRYVNMSMTDVQLNNGLFNGVASGRRINYAGAGFLYAVAPIIPGQTRDNVAGFHRRGPSPLNYQAMWEAGPGAQPANPGGPGKIAAPVFYNPMTG